MYVMMVQLVLQIHKLLILFPPFDYLWSTGDTTPNIANLNAGTYSFQVRNSNGCMQIRILC